MNLPTARFLRSIGVSLLCALPLPTLAQVTPPATTVPATSATIPENTPTAWEFDEIVNADLLKIQVVFSRTAQIFHIVDQISQWNSACHKQYSRLYGGTNGDEFTDQERAMLQKHVQVRQKHGWGQGLEQTFYVPLGIEAAARDGVTKGHLSEEEAATEIEVLNFFAAKFEPLITRSLPTITRFRDDLKTERLPIAVFTRQLSRFCGNRRLKLPVYLIVNSHDVSFGSAVLGGKTIIEIPRFGDAYTALLRSLLGTYIEQYPDELNRAVSGVTGLDAATLTQAIELAAVPGLLRPASADDQLLLRVSRDLETRKPLTESGVLVQRFALMLRPALAAALADKTQTLPQFLPHAVDIWRSMNELQRAASTTVSAARVSKAPSIFVFGNLDTILVDYFQTGTRNLFSRPHQAEAYRELIGKFSKPNDLVVLLATTETLSHIPTDFQDLLPLPLATLQEKLDRGESVIMEGNARRLKVVLLAAPKQLGLDNLVRQNRSRWQ